MHRVGKTFIIYNIYKCLAFITFIILESRMLVSQGEMNLGAQSS